MRQMYSSLAALIVFAHSVASLSITPLAPPANPQETQYLAVLNKAVDLANTRITAMDNVLKNSGTSEHKKIIDATFGTNSQYLDTGFMKNTVARLKTGQVPVQLPLASGAQTIAFTLYDDTKTPMVPLHVEFGKKYYAKTTSLSAQAATLLHEATHYLSDTGDYIIDRTFIPGSDHRISKDTGYTSQLEPYTTVNQINADKKFVRMRDGYKPEIGPPVPPVKSMHLNAESYAQLSSMAGNL